MVFGLDGVAALNRSNGGECPARAACTLIFNWIDGTFGPPVNRVGDIGLVEDLVLLLFGSTKWLISTESLHLIFGPGGELIVPNRERAFPGVDFIDLGVFLREQLESELVLLLRSELEPMNSNVFDELALNLLGSFEVLAPVNANNGGCLTEELHIDFIFFLKKEL